MERRRIPNDAGSDADGPACSPAVLSVSSAEPATSPLCARAFRRRASLRIGRQRVGDSRRRRARPLQCHRESAPFGLFGGRSYACRGFRRHRREPADERRQALRLRIGREAQRQPHGIRRERHVDRAYAAAARGPLLQSFRTARSGAPGLADREHDLRHPRDSARQAGSRQQGSFRAAYRAIRPISTTRTARRTISCRRARGRGACGGPSLFWPCPTET